ncbi:hypothetical protein [Halobacterium jilantaiense]|uniref:Uncharacterized protein n=1 Tax=Halobacterium jilantaiense TaxID=355548 RepID=A0A1I0QQ73_9EURY|nr:hypothetical protein [Halobacterium jilantaiense]SEW29390.1 hypothetical protein SAMN04487945_2824 [Halobacterium jilantaiense]
MTLADRIRVSARRQRQAARGMQLSLVGFLFVGVYEGDPGIVANAGLGLAVTYLPAVLERDYGIPMDAGLTLWITSAVFLHALGIVGLPGSETNFYAPGGIPWWDHLTHALSSSVVAGGGYAVVRAVDEHSDDVELPPRFVSVFILSTVLAAGVFWEVVEYALMAVSDLTGGSLLVVYGLGDIVLDLVFNAAGAVVAAVWGTAHLGGVTAALGQRLGEWSTGE